MKLEDQVCSLELSKKLKALGVKQESQFLWNSSGLLVYRVGGPSCRLTENECNAFTVAELGEMLPDWFKSLKMEFSNVWVSTIEEDLGLNQKHEIPEFDAPTEADARAKMLIYLIEQGLVQP